MSKRGALAKIVLCPMSWLYGVGTYVRNKCFDFGLLKEKEFDVPVIVVGNLAVGGTGKTPHVEYIIEHMRHSHHLAMVSRGYKRSTSGFVMATRRSTPADIGDEPYQIYQKFGCEVPVAVCEDRVKGITELLRIDPDINLIVLDDAFQHRYVKPTVAVLLTEQSRPFFEDSMLPYGRLRESSGGVRRADIVVASKCSERMRDIDLRIFEENLKLSAWQKVFFSKLAYGKLKPIFPDQAPDVPPALDWLTEEDMLYIVAGIGNPKPFVKYLKHFKPPVRVNVFSDHHNYSKRDMAFIQKRFETMGGKHKFLITTEKDAVRMANSPYFPHSLKRYAYYLPVKVGFLRDGGEGFIDQIRKVIKEKERLRNS